MTPGRERSCGGEGGERGRGEREGVSGTTVTTEYMYLLLGQSLSLGTSVLRLEGGRGCLHC